MIDAPFRRLLPRFTRRLIAVYTRVGLTPNHITIAGFALAVGAAVCVACGQYALAVAVWWLSRLADGTDGIYARETGRVTDLGGFLDIVLDMAGYGAMVLGFAVSRPDLAMLWHAILFLYILCITGALALGGIERTKGLGAVDNRTLRLAAGLAEGGETGIAYSLFLLFPAYLGPLACLWIAILALTVITRILLAYKMLNSGATDAR